MAAQSALLSRRAPRQRRAHESKPLRYPHGSDLGDYWQGHEPDNSGVRFLDQQRLVKYQTQLIGDIDRSAGSRRRSLKSGCPQVLLHVSSLTRRTCQSVIGLRAPGRSGRAVTVYRSGYGHRQGLKKKALARR